MTTALLDLSPTEARRQLEAWLTDRGEPGFRSRQVLQEVYASRRTDPATMTALPLPLRTALAERWLPPVLGTGQVQESSDGTRKYRFELRSGGAIESVWIPSGPRGTLCVSSQVGCAAACTFCATGTLGLRRNLSPAEILEQWLVVDADLRDLGRTPVTQIVFMGMGEPLHNWPALETALTTLTAPEGFGFSPRRITVSTVGITPKIPALIERFPQVRLALSLHSAREETRARIVPVTQRHPLKEIREVLRTIRGDARRLSVEYVLLTGVNDAPEEAAALARFARELGAHVNLLPFHPFEGAPYAPTPAATLRRFAAWVREGYPGSVTVRRSRGLDIDGACGQLALRQAPHDERQRDEKQHDEKQHDERERGGPTDR